MASAIQDLEWFARESLLRGLSKQEIRKAMLDAGWTEDQIRNAVDAYADVVFPSRFRNRDRNCRTTSRAAAARVPGRDPRPARKSSFGAERCGKQP